MPEAASDGTANESGQEDGIEHRFLDWPSRVSIDCVTITHAALVSRLQGHFNYFGVNGNLRCLNVLLYQAKRVWYKWLRRRSQRVRLTWEGFAQMLRVYPLPWPRVVVTIWG